MKTCVAASRLSLFRNPAGHVKKPAIADFRICERAASSRFGIDPRQSIDVKLTNGQNEVVLITREGQSIRFRRRCPSMARRGGVRGSVLKRPTPVCGARRVVPDATLWWRGQRNGKRTDFGEYERNPAAGRASSR